jgi:hypothetical protein
MAQTLVQLFQGSAWDLFGWIFFGGMGVFVFVFSFLSLSSLEDS